MPAVKPERVVDTTGAGDSFGGAYLAGAADRHGARRRRRGSAMPWRREVIGVHGALAKIDREQGRCAAERDVLAKGAAMRLSGRAEPTRPLRASPPREGEGRALAVPTSRRGLVGHRVA